MTLPRIARAPAEYEGGARARGHGLLLRRRAADRAARHELFPRAGGDVFHTYSTFGRGAEMLGGSYYWLDLTAFRQKSSRPHSSIRL